MHSENSHLFKRPDNNPTDTSPSDLSVQDITDWMITQVADRFGLDANAIDPMQPFVRLGLDSIAALELLAALARIIHAPLAKR